jgi:thiamine-monophosphate kinase
VEGNKGTYLPLSLPFAYGLAVACFMPLPERQLIAGLKETRSRRNSAVLLGIGDDCAQLRLSRGQDALVTTDLCLEGVHFRRDWQSPDCIGHRCLARGLSDVAAMGGTPIAAFLPISLPSALPQKWVDRFFTGLLTLAESHRVELAGGDTAQSLDGVLADITVLGSIRRNRALRRSGARVGDQIYVSGELGESAATLHLLTQRKLRRRNVFPEPRIALGQWLSKRQVASAAIDISDGLSTDLSHICEESGVGAAIEAEAIPIHSTARKFGNQTERRTSSSGDFALDLALHGGDDYELLFTAPGLKRVQRRIAGVKITRIGEIVRGSKMHLIRREKKQAIVPFGWEHFRNDQ